MITEEQLLSFAAKEDIRYWLMTPYIQDGFVVASNGHICIRTTGEFASAKTHSDVNPSNIVALVEKAKLATSNVSPLVILALPPADQCKPCDGSGKESICPACDGEGEITQGEYSFECNECDGDGVSDNDTGNVRNCWHCDGTGEEANQEVWLGNGYFSRRYLAKIQSLPGAQIKTNGESDAAYFTFDGGDGALMPLRHRE